MNIKSIIRSKKNIYINRHHISFNSLKSVFYVYWTWCEFNFAFVVINEPTPSSSPAVNGQTNGSSSRGEGSSSGSSSWQDYLGPKDDPSTNILIRLIILSACHNNWISYKKTCTTFQTTKISWESFIYIKNLYLVHTCTVKHCRGHIKQRFMRIKTWTIFWKLKLGAEKKQKKINKNDFRYPDGSREAWNHPSTSKLKVSSP